MSAFLKLLNNTLSLLVSVMCLQLETCEARPQYLSALNTLSEHPLASELRKTLTRQNHRTVSEEYSCFLCHAASWPERNEFGIELEMRLVGIDSTDEAQIYPVLEATMRSYVNRHNPSLSSAQIDSPLFPELPWYYRPVAWTLLPISFVTWLLFFRELLQFSPRNHIALLLGIVCLATVAVGLWYASAARYPPL